MRFMNRWEIDEASDDFAQHPVLGPATRTLRNLRDCADNNSDGWAHWPKPSRAADKLITMIADARLHTIRVDLDIADVDLSPARLRNALAPIKSFRTRTGLEFAICESLAEVEALNASEADTRKRAQIALAQQISNEYGVSFTPEPEDS